MCHYNRASYGVRSACPTTIRPVDIASRTKTTPRVCFAYVDYTGAEELFNKIKKYAPHDPQPQNLLGGARIAVP